MQVTGQISFFYGRWLPLIDSQWKGYNFADVGEKAQMSASFQTARPALVQGWIMDQSPLSTAEYSYINTKTHKTHKRASNSSFNAQIKRCDNSAQSPLFLTTDRWMKNPFVLAVSGTNVWFTPNCCISCFAWFLLTLPQKRKAKESPMCAHMGFWVKTSVILEILNLVSFMLFQTRLTFCDFHGLQSAMEYSRYSFSMQIKVNGDRCRLVNLQNMSKNTK